jgi:HrpA-like RNA helicase
LKEVHAKRPNIRVILMSATMDTECFLKYFSLEAKVVKAGGNEETAVVRPPLVICPAFCHPVVELYLEGVNNRLGRDKPAEAKSPDELRRDPNGMSESDGIDYDLIVQLIEELERSPDGAWTFATGPVKAKPKDPHKGAILIFLPGLGEITQLMTKLQEESWLTRA